MFNLILRLAFGGRWFVQVTLALAAFGLAAFLYAEVQKDEAAKALALQNGPPQAVSLNSFDPATDIHAADEAHVTGWINVDYNYQLTEERRRGSDTVRRMFVLFGPDDTSATKSARAVVLMPEADVDRFVESVVTNPVGQVEGNPLFTLNGTARRSATLDNMADDMLAENGLTKAPGFRYIEIWPAGGRAEALAPAPEVALTMAGVPGAVGLLLLIVAAAKLAHRKARPEAGAASVAAAPLMQNATPAMAMSAPAAGPMSKGLLRQREVEHPIYNPPRYSDPADAEIVAAVNPDPVLPDPVAAVEYAPAAPGGTPDTSQPEQQFAAGPVASARPKPRRFAQFGRYAAASALLGLLYLGSNHLPVDDYLTKISGVVMPASPSAPEAAPVTEAKVAATAPVVDTSLIPAAASLRPKGPAAPTAVAPLPLRPVAAAEAAPLEEAAQPRPEAVPDPASTAARPPQSAPVTPLEAAPAETAVPAALADADALGDASSDDPAPPAAEASLLSVLPLPSLGQLVPILPVLGAVLLALAALALMRGRQTEPPAVFAGRDPWEKLAREARSTQG